MKFENSKSHCACHLFLNSSKNSSLNWCSFLTLKQFYSWCLTSVSNSEMKVMENKDGKCIYWWLKLLSEVTQSTMWYPVIKITVLSVWSAWRWGTRSEAGTDHWTAACSWLFQSQNKRLVIFWQGDIICVGCWFLVYYLAFFNIVLKLY